MSQWWQWWCLCLCCHREQHERIFESRLNDVENKMASSLQSVQESCAVLSSRVTSDSQVIAYLRAFACSIQIDPCTWSVVEKKLYSKKTEISKKWQDQFCCIFHHLMSKYLSIRCVSFIKIFYPETRALRDCRPLQEAFCFWALCDCVHVCGFMYKKFLTHVIL